MSKILVTILFIVLTMSLVPLTLNMSRDSGKVIVGVVDSENISLSKVEAVGMMIDAPIGTSDVFGSDIVGMIRYYIDEPHMVQYNNSNALESSIDLTSKYSINVTDIIEVTKK